MAALPDVYMPEIGIGVMATDDGREVMTLEFTTAGTEFRAVIATKENYRQVADKIAEGIRRAGAEMKIPSPLITNVKDIPDGLRKRE